MGSSAGVKRRMYGATAPSGMSLTILQEEIEHPDWEISAADRRDRDDARQTCADHLSDLRQFQTKLRSYILRDEYDGPFLR
jgi:hypothetical protein